MKDHDWLGALVVTAVPSMAQGRDVQVSLNIRRSLNEGLASPRTNTQTMLHVTLIPGQGDDGGVCCDIYRVQYLGSGCD